MAYTTKCIVCAANYKHRPASLWTGYVLLFDESEGKIERKEVVAGFCKRHQEESKTMPHQGEVSRKKWCYGMWTGDMGIDSSSGPLLKEY